MRSGEGERFLLPLLMVTSYAMMIINIPRADVPDEPRTAARLCAQPLRDELLQRRQRCDKSITGLRCIRRSSRS